MANGDLKGWEVPLVFALVNEWAEGNPRRLKEVADMRHECLVKWLEVRHQYIALPQKRAKGAARTVVRRFIIERHRRATTQSRGEDSNLEELPDDAPVMKSAPDPTIPIAVQQMLPKLSERHQAICKLLMDPDEDLTQLEIAARLGIDRNDLAREIRKIREKFERWGLDLG